MRPLTLEEARHNIGSGVVYCPEHGPREDGVITSVGACYVFVRFAGDVTPKATPPEALTLLAHTIEVPSPERIDLVAALRRSVEAAKRRREAGER